MSSDILRVTTPKFMKKVVEVCPACAINVKFEGSEAVNRNCLGDIST